MKLRDYQKEAIEIAVNAEGNCLLTAATGAGKTIIFSKIIENLKNNWRNVLVLAHRKELVKQARDKLKASTGLGASIFSASLGTKNLGDITIASVQSLARYEGELNFDVVIVDEAHKIPPPDVESQYGKVLKKLGCKLIGVTATPYRLNQGYIYGKGRWFKDVDFDISTSELISMGFLVSFVHKVTQRLDLSEIKVTAGEYNQGQLEGEMVKEVHLDALENDVEKYASDRKSIVIFATSILHAEMIHERIGGEIVHSKMSTEERDSALMRFDSGESRFMTNVDVLTEGWDCPRTDCVLLARPTQSPSLYVQMAGRGLRLSPETGKKDCLILDLANNGREHGSITNVYVCDERQKTGTNKEAQEKICDECMSLNPPGSSVCLQCGHSLVEKVEVVSKVADYEMVELTPEYWEATGGSAEHSKTRAGEDCVILTVWLKRGTQERLIRHWYLKKWSIEYQFKKIVRRFTKYNADKMTPDIFVQGVNSGKLFPIKEVEIFEKKSGFLQIRGF